MLIYGFAAFMIFLSSLRVFARFFFAMLIRRIRCLMLYYADTSIYIVSPPFRRYFDFASATPSPRVFRPALDLRFAALMLIRLRAVRDEDSWRREFTRAQPGARDCLV